MFRLPRCLAAVFLGGALCLTSLPAAAQWVAPGRWGTDESWRLVLPGTWQVLRRDAATIPVLVTAEGDNNVGRIELWCDAQTGGSALRLSAYRGAALRRPVAYDEGDAGEPVHFVIDGQRFDRAIRYDFDTRSWHAQDMLDAAFLDAFAWGMRMELRNAAEEVVTSYRLNASSAAREALRESCGF